MLVNLFLSPMKFICHSSDNGLKVRAIFVDISEVFDTVRHEGLILKQDCSGLSGNILRFEF